LNSTVLDLLSRSSSVAMRPGGTAWGACWVLSADDQWFNAAVAPFSIVDDDMWR
jgi:hypothetical protein